MGILPNLSFPQIWTATSLSPSFLLKFYLTPSTSSLGLRRRPAFAAPLPICRLHLPPPFTSLSQIKIRRIPKLKFLNSATFSARTAAAAGLSADHPVAVSGHLLSLSLSPFASRLFCPGSTTTAVSGALPLLLLHGREGSSPSHTPHTPANVVSVAVLFVQSRLLRGSDVPSEGQAVLLP